MKSVIASCMVLSVASNPLRAEPINNEAITVSQLITATSAFNHAQAVDTNVVEGFIEEDLYRRGTINNFMGDKCEIQ